VGGAVNRRLRRFTRRKIQRSQIASLNAQKNKRAVAA
jgi:hypothetical protein